MIILFSYLQSCQISYNFEISMPHYIDFMHATLASMWLVVGKVI